MPFKEVIPMLGVSNLKRSIAFYERLGFHVGEAFSEAEGAAPIWVSLESGTAWFMINQLPKAATPPNDRESKKNQVFYLFPDSVDTLHAELTKQKLPVSPLRITIYGMKEFELEDPDGYQLTFGQSTAEDPTEDDSEDQGE